MLHGSYGMRRKHGKQMRVMRKKEMSEMLW